MNSMKVFLFILLGILKSFSHLFHPFQLAQLIYFAVFFSVPYTVIQYHSAPVCSIFCPIFFPYEFFYFTFYLFSTHLTQHSATFQRPRLFLKLVAALLVFLRAEIVLSIVYPPLAITPREHPFTPSLDFVPVSNTNCPSHAIDTSSSLLFSSKTPPSSSSIPLFLLYSLMFILEYLHYRNLDSIVV